MNFPNLRQMAGDSHRYYGFEASKLELLDALNIIDVFAKLDAEIAGCTTKRGRTYFFVINDGDDVVINFEITAEQAGSIERMEKATLLKDVEG